MEATTETSRFDTTWEEWIEGQDKTALLFIEPRLLRSIAGLFYLTGATHATEEARKILSAAGSR